MSLSNLKLTLTADRKLVSIECDDFRIKLNGNSNADYATMLKPLGIVVTFVGEAPDVVVDNLKRFPDGTLKPFLTPEKYAELSDDDKFLYNEQVGSTTPYGMRLT